MRVNEVIKKFLLLMVAGGAFLQCNDDTADPETECLTAATVRDLSGLDGCGFVFEKSDGSYLEPVRNFFCGTPPLPQDVENDPLRNFTFRDGQRVMIGYTPAEMASVCMAGAVVKITCIREIDSGEN